MDSAKASASAIGIPPLEHLPNHGGTISLSPRPARKPKERWLGDDGRNVFIECQGDFAAIAIRKGPLNYKPPKRGSICGFSRASRLRLLKLIHRFDPDRAGRATFATCTWRDELGRPTPERITQARSDCQRRIERLADKPLAGLWRVEWKIRRSGRFKGQWMPHLHCLYYDIPFIDKEDWSYAWAASIGWRDKVSVKLEECKNVAHVGRYVAKYMAKVDFSCNLDIPSYLNKHMRGRKWGVYRKELLPWAERKEIRVAPGKLVDKCRAIAKEQWAGVSDNPYEGFTIFGKAAHEIANEIRELS